MAETVRSGLCGDCGQQRKVVRPRTNHVLHLLLTIITFGVWLIAWIGVGVKFGGWRCDTCGSTKIRSVH